MGVGNWELGVRSWELKIILSVPASPCPCVPASPRLPHPHFTTTPLVRILRKRQAIAKIFTALKY
nr:hypothetical protein [Nostoc sp. ZfuVER08]